MYRHFPYLYQVGKHLAYLCHGTHLLNYLLECPNLMMVLTDEPLFLAVICPKYYSPSPDEADHDVNFFPVDLFLSTQNLVQMNLLAFDSTNCGLTTDSIRKIHPFDLIVVRVLQNSLSNSQWNVADQSNSASNYFVKTYWTSRRGNFPSRLGGRRAWECHLGPGTFKTVTNILKQCVNF